MSIKPFNTDNGYTQFHNYVIDEIMPTLGPNAWKVLCLIIRKTRGWHKDEDAISYSQIMSGTGIKNRTTVSAALDELTTRGYVIANARGRRASTYRLNQDYTAPDGSTKIEQSEICTTTSTEIVPPVVQKSDTQKKAKKERKHAPAAPAAREDEKISAHPLTLKMAEICRIDLATATHTTKQQLFQSARILIGEGCTVEELRAAGLDWFQNDWRSGDKSRPIRQRQAPTPARLREKVGELRRAVTEDNTPAWLEERKEQGERQIAKIEQAARPDVKLSPEEQQAMFASFYALSS